MKKIKQNPEDIYRFLRQFELTAEVAFQKACDTKAAVQLIEFAQRTMFKNEHPSEIRQRLSDRWQRLKKMKRGHYAPI